MTAAPLRLIMGGTCLPALTEFKYLSVVFNRRLTWSAHTKYFVKRCKTRINFIKSISGTSWGSNPDNMLILFKGLVWLVYGCVCIAEMAEGQFGFNAIDSHGYG
jgi:hypothetical protein